MKKGAFIGIAIALISILVISINFKTHLNKKKTYVDVIAPKEEKLASEIILSGVVELKSRQKVFFDNTLGNDYKILVDVNDLVDKGTALVKYNNPSLVRELELLETQIEAAYLNINFLKKGSNELPTNQEKEQSKLDVRIANIELRQLQIEKESLKEKLDALTVRSAGGGKVLNVATESYNTLENDIVLLDIGSEEKVIKGSINEYDALVLDRGKSVRIKSDSIPDGDWNGVLSQINYYSERRSQPPSETTELAQYPIIVEIDKGSDQELLKPGFEMLLHIVLDNKLALTIPSNSIHEESGKSYVFVVNDGMAKKLEIETGMADKSQIEILKGLTTSEQVILSDEEISDGQGVKIND